MIHYAVTEGEYSCYHIIAICSNKQKAENIAKFYNAEVEEYDDGQLDDKQAWFDVTPAWNWKCSAHDSYVNSKPKLNEQYTVILKETPTYILYYVYDCIHIYVKASDELHAVKAAQDILAEYKEENGGYIL